MGESAAPTTGQTDSFHSTPLQDARMMPLPPAHTVPPARLGTPQVPYNELNTQDSGSHMSQMSGPLFTEDRLSINSSDADACDTEVPNITQRCTPLEVSTVVMSPRPGSHSTVDYSTQGDPEQQPELPDQQLTPEQQWIVSTQNYLLPDGSGRRIYDIPIYELHAYLDFLQNGHAVYQIQLPKLESILETMTFLMDRVYGQCYAVYEDGYNKTTTVPMAEWSTDGRAQQHQMTIWLTTQTRGFICTPACYQPVPPAISDREARASTSTQLRKMKLYLTSLMSHHSPEPYTTKNLHSAWGNQTTC